MLQRATAGLVFKSDLEFAMDSFLRPHFGGELRDFPTRKRLSCHDPLSRFALLLIYLPLDLNAQAWLI